MKFWENVRKILNLEAKQRVTLGNPIPDEGERLARKVTLASMVGGKGFRTPPKEPKTHPTFGTTRGQRKRAAREAINAKVSEVRPVEHIHPRRMRQAIQG